MVAASLAIKRDAATSGWHWHLSGDWRMANLKILSAYQKNIKQTCRFISHEGGNIILNGKDLDYLDTAGAWALVQLLHAIGADAARIEYQHISDAQRDFIIHLAGLDEATMPAPAKRASGLYRAISHTGEAGYHLWRDTMAMVAFVGQIATMAATLLPRPRNWHIASIVRHMDEAGIRAIPIIALLAFLISIVLAYQGAIQLRNFGADIFVVDLMVVSILREMGVVLTSIMVAGRSGSAFAAEIGVMKLRGEVDAMRVIGLNPFAVLVLPRIIALVIMLPILTFIANIVGLAGGAVMAWNLLDISFSQYIDRIQQILEYHTFVAGMIKAPVFAFLIAMVGCFQGMRVRGSAESVGQLTTIAVVQAIFLVMLADALFSILLAEIGI